MNPRRLSMSTIWLLLLLIGSDVFAQSCTASNPCAEGCCSKSGYCGLGPDYCAAANCVGTCDRKSECDPANWGSTYANATTCPLNVCCSKYGFCGTTSEFCGSSTVTSPSCPGGTSSNGKTIGYYEGWAITRGCNNMYPEQINAAGLTHLNYAFALIDPKSFAVAPMAAEDMGLYSRATKLKSTNPGLKVWISIGGWTMNDPDQPTAKTFSQLAASSSAQSAFFASLLQFLSTYGFDGLDIDWEYPVAPERSGSPADFVNYVSFLANLKSALGAGGNDYGLSITIPSSYWYMRGFDIVKLSSIVDWFNVITYDLHGTWDSTDKWIGAIAQAHTNLTEIDQTMQLLWRNNIDPAKVVLGLGFYGRSFKLKDSSCTAAGCPFVGGANPGPCTQTSGILSFSEIEAITTQPGTSVKTDLAAAVQIVTWGGDQWVSYDNVATLKSKVDYANNRCLGGTMIWAVTLDSNNGTALSSLSQTTGRIAASQKNVVKTAPNSQFQGCVITDCASSPTCPAGTSAVQQVNNKPQNVLIPDCPKGQSRTYCCNSQDMPTCHWIGSAKLCFNRFCAKEEIQLSTDTADCWFNYKTLCCSKNQFQISQGQCRWENGCTLTSKCSDGTTPLRTASTAQGWNFCFVGSYKYCCDQPPPYTNCVVPDYKIAPLFICNSECPAGKTKVTEDTQGCFFGSSSALCCDAILHAFAQQLNAFKSDPVCSISDYQNFPDPIEDEADAAQYKKRELEETNLVDRNLVERDLSAVGEYDFVSTFSSALLGRSRYSDLMRQQIDQTFGSNFNFHASSGVYLINADPEQDPNRVALDLLCSMSQQNIDQYAPDVAATSQLCQLPASRKRSLEGYQPDDYYNETLQRINDLSKRVFAKSSGTTPMRISGPSLSPTIVQAMRLVAHNQLRPLYIRQIWYTGPHANSPNLDLEIAFDIRNSPSVQTQQIPSPPGPEPFMVFHFHTRGLGNYGGTLEPEIYSFSVYHSWGVRRSNYNSEYRVSYYEQRGNPNGRNTARAQILQCPLTGLTQNPVWVPGPRGVQTTTGLPGDIVAFGNYLHGIRVLDSSSFLFPGNPNFITWDPNLRGGMGDWANTGITESENFGPGGNVNGATNMDPAQGWPQRLFASDSEEVDMRDLAY